MPLKRIQEHSGTVNQYAIPSLVPDNQAQLLVNVSQKYLGAWSHRLGTTRFGERISASNPIRGLHMFEKNDGTFYLHVVHDGDLYVYNEGTGLWGSAQQADVVGSSSEVDFANFIERHYFIGSGATEYLKYATESGSSTQITIATGTVSASSTGSTLVASTSIFNSGMVGFLVKNTTDNATRTITAYTSATTVTVSSAINDTWDGDDIEIYMDGKYLATNGEHLVVSGSSVQPLRTYASGLQDDTFDVAADYAITNTSPTGVAAFGNGRPFIIFTNNSYLIWNPRNGQTTQVDDYGCSSHGSIKVLKGYLIWFDRGRFYRLAYNQAFPEEISLPLTNEANDDAVMDQINPTNYDVVAAGVVGNSYFAALRDLSSPVKGVTLNDCVVEYDISREAWSVHTYTAGGIGTVFAQFINSSGNRDLYAGSIDNGTVYKMNVADTYTDDDSDDQAQTVTSTIIGKQHEFGDKEVFFDKIIQYLYLKYRAASTITATYALDGSSTFNNWVTIPAANTDSWVWKVLALGRKLCKAFTPKYTTTGDFDIHEEIFDVENTNSIGVDPI